MGRSDRHAVLAAFDREAATLYPDPTLVALNARFFGQTGFAAIPDASAPEGSSVAATLQNRRGTCVGLAIVYLAFAERLGLDARAVATPVHLFVRVRLPDGVRNVELMEGGIHLDDDIYRRRYRIDSKAIEAGVFMRDLTTDQVLAHLLSNQGVTLSRQGKTASALRRYRKALELAPDLVVAWYNQGIDLMKQGKLEKALASFDTAIGIYASDGPAHNNRGLVRLKMGDVEGARADFERALQLEPGMREAEENLKRLLAR
ncbi:MAG TPA: tetratricopeptide repeat protein [Candidatus Polarisedimenticolia bacterium]|nr:tetratricopeptide repeat protein [Candidatus Polarisedimenticolia bacterium]